MKRIVKSTTCVVIGFLGVETVNPYHLYHTPNSQMSPKPTPSRYACLKGELDKTFTSIGVNRAYFEFDKGRGNIPKILASGIGGISGRPGAREFVTLHFNPRIGLSSVVELRASGLKATARFRQLDNITVNGSPQLMSDAESKAAKLQEGLITAFGKCGLYYPVMQMQRLNLVRAER